MLTTLSIIRNFNTSFASRPRLCPLVQCVSNSSPLELMYAKFATAKISKDLNPLKISPNRCYLPEYNTEEF